jgi:hypothetical protein
MLGVLIMVTYITSSEMSHLADSRKKNSLLPETIWIHNDFNVISYKLIIRRVIPVPKDFLYPPQSYERVHESFKKYIDGESSIYSECFCPLYIFTYKEDKEKLTWYVGETNKSPKASQGRIEEGHHAVPGLTDEYFSKKEKEIYIMQIFLSYCHEGILYQDVPLEWIEFERTDEEKKSKRSKDKYKKITTIIKYLEWVIMERTIAARNRDREMPQNIKNIEVDSNYIEIYFENGKPIDIDLQAEYEPVSPDELILDTYEKQDC